ncbi:MAG TPA: hypothetical protein VL485_21725 [Ktedonobacteraceae bacterium]|nr:hypothetical protein [Ktedonobacteraceae bacterium]
MEHGEPAMWSELQTIKMTYHAIAQGERPWTALGDFMNYWFCYSTTQRAELIEEPLQEPVELTPELHQWAAFCAASVEYLCERYAITCPDWVSAPSYILEEPWFKGLGAHKPNVQTRLRQETPECFARRNIYCGNRIFANKYELAAEVQQRQSA